MKFRKIYTLLFLYSASLIMSSCKKFLDEKSDATLVVPTSLTDLQGLLDDSFVMNSNTASFGEASADDYFLPEATYNARIDRQKAQYRWTPYEYNFQNDWSFDYNAVYVSNVCLERLESIAATTANKSDHDNIKGSALFFRGFYQLDLLQEYGKGFDKDSSEHDPGIVLRLNSDFNQPSSRATVAASFNQIIKDTKDAASFLPDHSIISSRPSRPAAFALLGRTYLLMQEFDSSLKYAKLALSVKNELLDYNELNAAAAVPFMPYNKEIIFYSRMNGAQGTFSTTRGKIDTLLFAEYASADLRRQIFFSASGNYQFYKGSYIADRNLFFSGLATDELYLITAECAARLGMRDEALNYLNSLLIKRFKTGNFITVTATNSNDALDIILSERRKELIFRGLRWPDIKRLNRLGNQIILRRKIAGEIIQLLPNADYYALPLPADIIKQTGLKQN